MSTYIWDFSSNPTLLTTTSDNIDSILLSSDGTYAIATISDMAYLWNFIDNTSNQLSITDVSNSDITWAANNRYIVVNSDTEIYSYDIKNYTKSTLLEKMLLQTQNIYGLQTEMDIFTM